MIGQKGTRTVADGAIFKKKIVNILSERYSNRVIQGELEISLCECRSKMQTENTC
jgi:hypothetical protein